LAAKIRSIGIIRLEPIALDRLCGTCDDSTLDMLLASLGHRRSLTGATAGRPAQLTAVRRLNWPVPSSMEGSVQVHMAQLIDDLQAEFERIESAGP
jgi:hypothetical protein